ncbi:16S rRNA (cytosine(1402)-N(4))-methyltransferase RsmH [Flavobacteriaceae bacterium]|jgi:16S rRNA (cytosine1402-N4)-methyltransferase|uniref:16S rRNA (cytosine(1402)-N(4))-methyltransferase RsmH n=1 Tax=Formosa sp. Hel3_A1_48 TaxID=1336795 RepID=UPI00084E240E|nr:16S rRNA (cytosine(1402)-N(4))-methyltransferase RsmH [Formosa sp. Hel3_A1_48]MDA9760412.1 16S rRNA (cytosine(1402)-N(4))-methyltransferase RsmH [Flavobacteriaceae bacterium]AOR25917.1 16S rRNA methyltransferase [Formosa sp. Hel3_A1_48]MDC0371756.1 16S rRNA (cytosine(1402)-N(4))-methyltransferase RsmH [Flavobacteriaceae bacterium]MDC0950665.1 16S rRNA (cytosine(1402)-N(4))-methyltransferase RsmH [Flavobacteriaceae bacterium]MDG1672554.1 16S rRNA (cytosine(1402)-N(4))-methyltransferase RsmH 
MEYHSPVLLNESVNGLAIKKNGVYVDVTFGGGGHSRKILQHLGPEGRLFAFDQDKDALSNTIKDDRFVLINENFKFMKRFLRFHGVKAVDGILADFGVSSYQFDAPERGFSIRFDAPLDMRMNQEDKLSAKTIVDSYSEEELRRIFWDFGELRSAPAIARTIVEARSERPIETTFELKKLLHKFLPRGKNNKILAQIYQAIRIEVNNELEVLKLFLIASKELLKTEGRLSVISYHSLEDRLVKRFIRNGMFQGEPERDVFGNYSVPLEKVGKLIVPTDEEIKINNRARSAKLRIAKKI